jgi:hypothetical protein
MCGLIKRLIRFEEGFARGLPGEGSGWWGMIILDNRSKLF